MKGNDQIIETLNTLLADELTAISQYMVHSEMCANWGYARLHETVEDRAEEEMKHAEKLIGRIIFLEGKPIVSKLKQMQIGATVEAQINHDHEAEADAVVAYNAAIKLCFELSDIGTRELLADILVEEEEHIDWLEAQRDQIDQLGLPLYLSVQVK